MRYVDPTGEDWWNPLSWGQDISTAVNSAASAVGNWWASSSIWDKIDAAMTIIGFIPGLDVISDAYFLGRAIVDVVQGKGSWADVAMNAAFLLAPAVGGAVFRVAKTALNALDGAADAGRAINKVDNLADGAKSIAKTDVGGGSAARGGAGPVAKGKAGVAKSEAKATSQGDRILGKEITMKAPDGTRTRLDLVAQRPDGTIYAIESKNGLSALTPNQEKAFPQLRQGGGIFVGGNAKRAGLDVGVPQGPIDIIEDWW